MALRIDPALNAMPQRLQDEFRHEMAGTRRGPIADAVLPLNGALLDRQARIDTLTQQVQRAEAENKRLRSAMQWLEDKARARKLEIAPSIYGTGFEFGFWPTGDAKVVNAKTLLDAVEAAQRPNVGHERQP